jgi:protein O-GlcNAc transferase
LEDAPERHRTRAETYAAATYQQRPLPGQAKVSRKPKRIRLGYFSTDFKEHPVAYLMAKMLEQHDRAKFEVFGYSLHGSQQTDMRQRLAKSFESFADVQNMTDDAVALQARQDGIDIAIDLNGYTQHNRLGIFAYRAAPIQVNYLGYPGTLGTNFIDYIVADQTLIPEDKRRYYSEQIIYLPHTYQPTDNQRELSDKRFTREQMGLPEDGFVFCCFNNNYKISPREFDIWMRLLGKVEGSVLWLFKSSNMAQHNLRKEAQARGVDPSRLVFAEMAPQPEHLKRQKLADLFLDTFNYNAHTTASDALWAGLPVVTKMGQGFAARVAGSLLKAVGMPELIAETERHYEALIFDLATNSSKLANARAKLAANRLTEPLFNSELYTRHLENGYQQAYQNHLDGNSPQTITVPL